MQKSYNVTWDYCRTSMIPIGKKYSIDAVFALTKAEDIWRGVEKCLYGNGNAIHFSKYGELPCIRANISTYHPFTILVTRIAILIIFYLCFTLDSKV